MALIIINTKPTETTFSKSNDPCSNSKTEANYFTIILIF